MQILDPAKIKDEKKRTEQETQRRILGLQHEEAEANKRTNLALENEKREKARIAAAANAGVPELMAKKSTLENEVAVLEKRKAEALKPIELTIEKAEAQLAENQKQGELIKAKLAQLDKDQELLLDRLDKQSEDAGELNDKATELDRREAGLKAAEDANKQTAVNLGQKLADFYQEVAKVKAELSSRETQLNMQTEANLHRQKIQNLRDAELSKKALAIEDGYRNLAAARKEILGREE